MKKINFLSQALFIALFIGFTSLSRLNATDYTISFTASGAATTISSVEVQNLTQSTNIIVPAGAPVNLTNTTAIPQLKYDDYKLKVYPNPITDKANVNFYSEFGGITDIVVFGIDGKSVVRYSRNLPMGINEFKLTLPKGFYGLHINQNGIVHYATVISQTNQQAQIEFTDCEISNTNTKQKIGNSVITLGYNNGDNILLKGYSGDLCTIITIKPPTKDTTVNFNFVECRDADGYNYPVVQIGTQLWMAENLKTTKYRNGDTIGTTIGAIPNDATSKYQWAYNGDENNVAKYGRLYTWYAATDSRGISPTGWHVPTDAEWSKLQSYLITNGYNYDGATTGNKIAKALASTTNWITDAETGTIGNDLTRNNSSGFTALPGGWRDYDGTFHFIDSIGSWWPSTMWTSLGSWGRCLFSNKYELELLTFSKSYGFSVRCVRDEIINNVLPTLTTTAITSDIWDFAVCGGNITNDGGSAITGRGVCWNTTGTPTISDSKTSNGTGTGSFSSNLTGLAPNTTYYVRAYATNSVGTAYGNEVSFKTIADTYTVTDIDGNVYHTVTIGTQTWMVENLKTTRYRNGDSINEQWAYNNDENNVAKYGRLYSWYAATDSRNIAPVGWHIPSDKEWTTLLNYLIANGYNYDGTTTENKIAKSLAATTDWTSDNSAGTPGNDLTKNNSSGFSALPGGYHMSNGTFYGVGSVGYWWSSSFPDYSTYTAYSWILTNNGMYFNHYNATKPSGFSVRCLKDSSNLNIPTSYIPAGTFTMGSPTSEANRNNDETQHEVTLSAFRMSKYEITNAQYAAFLNAKGIGSDGIYTAGAYPYDTLIYASSGVYDFGLHYTNNHWVPVAGYANNPVIYVTWYGATEYATYAGGTLPTEAQWEYACRAGTTTPFNTGNCLSNLQANYFWDFPYNTCTNSVTKCPGQTQAIGSYAPNAYGLYDMHGNVHEWCSDWYGNYPTTAQTNPTGPSTGLACLIRGGSWPFYAMYCRSASRNAGSPNNYDFFVGFRVVFVP